MANFDSILGMNHSNSSYQFSYREYSEALYAALIEDSFYLTLMQNVAEPPQAKEALLRYLDYSIREGEKFGESYFPSDHSYGVSVWAKPLDPDRQIQKESEKRQFLLRHMGPKCELAYGTITDFMSAQSASLVDRESWYLSIVGILPQYQNQGLGAKLVKDVLDKTDRLGVTTYLETFTPRNEGFYQRLGFHIANRFHEPTIDARIS